MGAGQADSKAMLILSVAELSPEAAGLLRADAQPLDYLNLLVAKKLYADAVRFLAHALPKRECVWWAWVCARRSSGEKPAPKIQSALDATEKWIAQPNEENRRAAKGASDAAGIASAAGCAGLAAFFSGGSLAPPEAPSIPPGDYLTAKAVSGAVIIAAVSPPPEKAPERFKSFIAQGVEVTQKIKLWEAKQEGRS
jgi:uncharacterized protein DUF6931